MIVFSSKQKVQPYIASLKETMIEGHKHYTTKVVKHNQRPMQYEEPAVQETKK